MINKIKEKFRQLKEKGSEAEYETLIADLISHEKVASMKSFIQHGDVTTLAHSLNVSYLSYRICRSFGLDYRSAARGGLLHDFFLYDWHEENDHEGLHGFNHPKIALKNAKMYFKLNSKEEDIILKHMWPLTIRLPKSREAFIVLMADNYAAIAEILIWHKQRRHRLKKIFGA